ncbi:MAG: DUF45 domain-containing protein [Betaproteobacteria bacterium]|nr:DUF45 domain-containing protein [Betaproteobacteria bacterium]
MDRGRGGEAGVGANLSNDLFPVTTVEEPRHACLRGRELTFRLRRSMRRTRIAFVVDEDGLTVHCPWNAQPARIDHALQDSAGWILRKLDQWSGRPPRRRLSWQTGDVVEYLGRPITLRVVSDPLVTIAELGDDQSLFVRLRTPEQPDHVRELVVAWYRRHAQRHFAERVRHFAEALGVDRPRLFLSGAMSRWGSCNTRGHVRLNWRLMQAPAHLVDYVVAHEIAHLRHLDHSRRFWDAVGRIYPDHEAARAELAAMSRHYMAL